jgi:hypothetical protein
VPEVQDTFLLKGVNVSLVSGPDLVKLEQVEVQIQMWNHN